MSVCRGNVEGCEAEEGLCPICRAVLACREQYMQIKGWQKQKGTA